MIFKYLVFPLSIFITAAACTNPDTAIDENETGYFLNPYENINWETVQYFDANLQAHTTLSDGSYDPHQIIDKYHEMGYHILALTDHDTDHHHAHPKSLYPWTELKDVYVQVKDQINPRYNETYGERANEEWQNRNPEELGMLALQGSELSFGHHIGSYFSDYAGIEVNEHRYMQEVGKRNGLAIIFHPGRYFRVASWYIDFYRTFSHVIGQEIYNQADRYPMDRAKWDTILHELMPHRPVWGFANDDTHGTSHFGWNRNVFLITDLTIENVRSAMEHGHLYLYIPVEAGRRPDVVIRNVETDRDVLNLKISGDYHEIQWITHNPETGNSETIYKGHLLNMSNVPSSARFVRAVILSDGGRTYTQPFGIIRENN